MAAAIAIAASQQRMQLSRFMGAPILGTMAIWMILAEFILAARTESETRRSGWYSLCGRSRIHCIPIATPLPCCKETGEKDAPGTFFMPLEASLCRKPLRD
jgi:hypothetical protein